MALTMIRLRQLVPMMTTRTSLIFTALSLACARLERRIRHSRRLRRGLSRFSAPTADASSWLSQHIGLPLQDRPLMLGQDGPHLKRTLGGFREGFAGDEREGIHKAPRSTAPPHLHVVKCVLPLLEPE